MSEAAHEVPIEELHAHPERWEETVASAAGGQVIAITGRGKRVAAVVPADQIALVDRLKETIEVLSDNEAVQAITESRRSIPAGEGIRGVDAIRDLLGDRLR
ncbi:type II toxin-antitoxin system prevent-host-death family antitoxin [Sphaerisporangium sp. NPDC005289]|uniref:type II toxin-antitoxin system prevent-host-death family antitoxin n=1 Tax=Sphaerisporangium sp. NPDC005289 TaxID=3155247 RepID=UPI0033A76DAE